MKEPDVIETLVDERRLTRRLFIKTAVGIGLGVGSSYFLGCAAPAQPMATPAKPTPTTVAPTSATPSAADVAASGGARTVTFASTSSGAVGLITEVIQKKGIDAKYGIKLDVKLFDPAAGEKAVLLKQTEVGLFPLVSAARAAAENVPVVIFAPMLYNHEYTIVREDSPYKSMADLKDKKIATLDKISGVYTSAQVFSKEVGGDFEKDYHIITGPPPAVISFLERGDVEAIIMHDPLVSNMLATGKYRQILAYSEEWKRMTGQPMFMIGLAAHRPWIEQNKAVAGSLNKMVLDATRYIVQHPEVFEENKKFLGLRDAAVKLAEKRMLSIYPDHWDANLIRNAKHIIDRAVELKIVPEAPKQDIFLIP